MVRGIAHRTTMEQAERVARDRRRTAVRIANQAQVLMEQGLSMRQALEATCLNNGLGFTWPAASRSGA